MFLLWDNASRWTTGCSFGFKSEVVDCFAHKFLHVRYKWLDPMGTGIQQRAKPTSSDSLAVKG